MRIYDIIEKKRNKKELTKEEIEYAVNNYVNGNLKPEQMSALLMAITINDMTLEETYNLTKCMQNSGRTYSFRFDACDKHSTGGVSDSTTLMVIPLLACLGLKMAKMSGKSLGFTGGTIDKLKVFKGYDPDKTEDEFKYIISRAGASVISQTEDIAYADKKMYALRDITATVDSIPLIASSIMSKKLASGANNIVLDVKYGSGAFMKSQDDAIKLAKTMVKIGKMDNKKICAVVTNMNTPLASGVGCTQEVYSAIKAIRGEDCRLRDLSLILASHLYSLATGKSYKIAEKKVNDVYLSGEIETKLKEIITLHGGSTECFNNIDGLFDGIVTHQVKAAKTGYINQIDALKIAKFVNVLKDSAGENDKHKVGIMIRKHIGETVNEGDVILTVYDMGDVKTDLLVEMSQAFEIIKKQPKIQPLVAKVIN